MKTFMNASQERERVDRAERERERERERHHQDRLERERREEQFRQVKYCSYSDNDSSRKIVAYTHRI